MSTGEKAFAAFFAIFAGVMGILSEGFVIMKLWGWYVVHEFNAPAMTMVTAIGISILWGIMSLKRRDYWPKVKDDDEELSDKLGVAVAPIIIYWAAFFAGWALLSFR